MSETKMDNQWITEASIRQEVFLSCCSVGADVLDALSYRAP
jgi:hypothetical protein